MTNLKQLVAHNGYLKLVAYNGYLHLPGTRLALRACDRTPVILDAVLDVDVTDVVRVHVDDVKDDTIAVTGAENYDLLRWLDNADATPAARAWRFAIRRHEAAAHVKACHRRARKEPDPHYAAIWLYHARSSWAHADGHAYEVEAAIALHDAAARHDSAR